MRTRITILSFVLLVLLCRCHPDPKCPNGQGIPFINHSSLPVYVMASISYPDTNLADHFALAGINPALDSARRKVLPDSTYLLLTRGACRESFFDKTDSNIKWMVFVLDAHMLAVTPWDTVVIKNLYLKRYDLNYADIVRMNWQIDYR